MGARKPIPRFRVGDPIVHWSLGPGLVTAEPETRWSNSLVRWLVLYRVRFGSDMMSYTVYEPELMLRVDLP